MVSKGRGMSRGRKRDRGREGGFLLGVAERGRDSVGGRCGLIVIGKAPRVFQLFPIRYTRVRERVTRDLPPLSSSPIVIALGIRKIALRAAVTKVESRTIRIN